MLFSRRGTGIWLGEGAPPRFTPGASFRLDDGSEGEVRVVTPGSHVRLTWRSPGWKCASTVQVRVLSSGERTVIAFHQEHLPGPSEREERRTFYRAALDDLGRAFSLLSGSDPSPSPKA